MAFVNGYLSIMALQMDILRVKMVIHLQEMMEDGETLGDWWWMPITRPGSNIWSKAGQLGMMKLPG